MSATILAPAVVVAQYALALAMALAAFRMVRGPRAQDVKTDGLPSSGARRVSKKEP